MKDSSKRRSSLGWRLLCFTVWGQKGFKTTTGCTDEGVGFRKSAEPFPFLEFVLAVEQCAGAPSRATGCVTDCVCKCHSRHPQTQLQQAQW